MQSVYRINLTACHKPWRYSSVFYTQNKELMDFIKNSEGIMADDIEWSKFSGNEDEDYYELFDKYEIDEEVKTPYILLDEVTVWTE